MTLRRAGIAALLATLACAPPVAAHELDDFASVVRSAPRGLAVEVVAGSDHLVLRNRSRRPATILAPGRGADVRVAPGGRIAWHDERARAGARAPRHRGAGSGPMPVRDWRIPVVIGERRRTIRGTLFYVEPRGAGAALPIAVGALTLVLVGGALVVLRRAAMR